MSLTASVGLMAIFLVDFVDMIFISMLGKAELAAAVGYAGVILFFARSFGIGQAVGGIVFGLLSAWLAWRVMSKVESGAVEVNKAAPFAREARQMQHGSWKR